MLSLYPDQAELKDRVLASLNSCGKTLMVMPTGAGKTVVAGKIIEHYLEKKKRIIICVHRVELANQFIQTLESAGFASELTIIKSGRQELPWQPIAVATVQTLAQRKHKSPRDLLVFDEAHHVMANTWQKIIKSYPNAQILGMTATPARSDKRGLGTVFGDMQVGLSMRELINMGRLSEYKAFTIPGIDATSLKARKGQDFLAKELDKITDKKAIASVINAIKQHSPNKRTLVFTGSIRASKEMRDRLIEAGFRAEHIDGSSEYSTHRRESILRQFNEGVIQFLCTVDLISEGFDCPACDCVVLARPTQSLTVYLQQIGRGLRYRVGKEAIILDCAGNIDRVDGGLSPCQIRDWALDDNTPSKNSGASSADKICQVCGKSMPPAATECPNCGFKQEALKRKPLSELNIDLVEINIAGVKTQIPKVREWRYDQQELLKTARAVYQANGIEGLYDLAETLGYKKEWAEQMAENIK